jgi:hypothetical protein
MHSNTPRKRMKSRIQSSADMLLTMPNVIVCTLARTYFARMRSVMYPVSYTGGTVYTPYMAVYMHHVWGIHTAR